MTATANATLMVLAACLLYGAAAQAADGPQTAGSAEYAGPVPTPAQAAWQEMEFIAFAHFGMNTFTDREWGEGKEDPKQFNPTTLDARQWVRVCKDAGIRMLILTAKHHDGFCLWPSRYTEHSVKNSPWKDGKGDVVKEVSDACRQGGLKFGVYLSPWDRHEPSYGDSQKYNAHFVDQLTELLTQYGDVTEVWFDGACAEGPNGKKQVYDWNLFYATVRRLQPKALIAICGPDIRWVGNENGLARETEWSIQPSPAGGGGEAWYPAECDVSIRPGWFYHAAEDGKVKSLAHLLDIYYASVGRNSVLLLNIPPDRRGLIHENDAARLRELRQTLDETFRTNLAKNKAAAATGQRGKDPGAARAVDGSGETFWAADKTPADLEVDLGKPTPFNVVLIREMITLGQRVEAFTLEAWDGSQWTEFAKGTTVGHKRLLRVPETKASKVRLRIAQSRGPAMIREFGLYLGPAAPAK